MSTISLKQSLNYGINELKKVKIDSARLDAEILLGFVLGFNREKMLSNPNLQLTTYNLTRFKKLIAKRKKHYPIAYLTGSKEFYGIDFMVNKNVLVPRPETELLVESVIDFCRGGVTPPKKGRGNRAPTILELGTGSGCIALTLAKYLPNIKIIAADISEKALRVARKNRIIVGNRHACSLQNARFKKSDLLQNIRFKPDIIVANLPYLDNDMRNLLKSSDSKALKYEPQIALKGGRDGLDLYRKMFQQIKAKWYQKGLINQTPTVIFIEIGENQAKSLKKYIQDLFPEAQIEIKKDLANRDRVAIIKIGAL
ncbi:MAG: peptide chain release factor N(5)-glutamine methyltransferase [Patescibacteria group bacterium]|nr:peptide chain release factor N(5)-glutamine methyltransferase [Patescibacteria group bacterium]